MQTAPETPPDSWPVLISKGSALVKIYRSKTTVAGVAYDQYAVVHHDGSRRIRKNFSDYAKAAAEANLCMKKLRQGEAAVLQLTHADRVAYLQAKELLRSIGQPPLNLAVADYVGAVKGLPAGASLRGAVEFYAKRHPSVVRSVQEVVDEFIAAKAEAHRSDKHLADMTSRLSQFAAAHQISIADVTSGMVSDYLANLRLKGGNGKVTGRTKRNHLRIVTSLLRFAARKRYLPKETLEELEAVEKPDLEHTAIEVFSPAELRELLASVRVELLPWLTIAAFAGLRSAELERLDWREVDLKRRHIEVTAAKAKTASRRLVPITDNLYAWLQPLAKESGEVVPFANVAKQIGWLVEDVNEARRDARNPEKFTWRHNALRHSYISYRLAAVKDVAQVALEAGNSPQMVFGHYRQLTTEEEGREWFALMPPSKAGIIPMPKAAQA